MNKFEAIHFDMDGVIADTEPLHVMAEKQTCIDYGFDINPDDWTGFKGRTAQDIFSYLISTYGDPAKYTPEELINHKTTLFLDMAKTRLEPIEGVVEFLNWARKAYTKMSLVTSSNKRVQSFIVDALGIGSLFDAVITGDDITEGKPSPQPYLKASKQLNITPNSSLVIEDSASGIQSGLTAGCAVLAVATSHTVEELLVEAPDYVAADYLDARRQLIAV
ncbi:MAG TPA: HAD family phosphatase [Patescibacteria group bacterium]|nr:HAD family phosphatase [Patescibacteria group bacterium]